MSDNFIYKNPSYSPEDRAEDLLSRMTLREKIAQLDMKFGNNYCTEKDPNHSCSVTPDTDYDWDKLKADFPDGLGYLHDNYSVPAVMNKLQKFFIENSCTSREIGKYESCFKRSFAIQCMIPDNIQLFICQSLTTVIKRRPVITHFSKCNRRCNEFIISQSGCQWIWHW